MTGQELAALLLVALAGLYLLRRLGVRRRRGTCCGERECGAAKRILERMAAAPNTSPSKATPDATAPR